MNKTIFHIDANCFFCRCEEIIDPNLEKIPFVVSERTRRSVVSTSNLVARQFNVKSADKIYDALNKCPTLKIVKSKYWFYYQKSNEMFACINKWFDCDMEIASIDECYLDVTNLLIKYHQNYEILAQQIKKKVFDMTKINVTIGIGNNKFLAKTAGDQKNRNGIYSIFKNELATKLWPLKIESMYMVGKKTNTIFKNLDIHTIEDLINYHNQDLLKDILMKRYDILIAFANGESSDYIDTSDNVRKSISRGKTFDVNTNDEIYLKQTLIALCQNIFRNLKESNLRPITLSIQIKETYHVGITKAVTYQDYLVEEKQLIAAAMKLFNQLWDGTEVRSLRVHVNNFQCIDFIKEQLKLF